jgi:hypothetical protein
MLTSLSDAMPLDARSTSSKPGMVIMTGDSTRKRVRDEMFLNAPVEVKRSADEMTIFKYKAEKARSDTEVAKGQAIGTLKAERKGLLQENKNDDIGAFELELNTKQIMKIQAELSLLTTMDVSPAIPKTPTPPPYPTPPWTSRSYTELDGSECASSV